ncbi:MAG: hemolysin family protein [Deferribacteraceae bacterium]|jgi:CBS domain containing-hemolysin-like protein|nr:hemolysin family protein [Deferribacteraceae bacterium]
MRKIIEYMVICDYDREFFLLDGSFSTITVLIVCIFSLSFLTATKMSLTTLGDLGIKHIMAAREGRAGVFNLWLNHSTRLMNTIVFCKISLIVIVTSVGTIFVRSYAGVHIIAFTALIVITLVIFAEVLPKALAKRVAAAVVLPNIYILRIFYYICYPVTSVMSALTALVAGVSADSNGKKRILTEDELEYLIDVSEEQGVLEERKQQMLSNIFDISDIYVKSVMVPRTEMVAVPHDIDKDGFIKLIQETGYSRFPVYENSSDRIIGILSIKQMINMLGKRWDIKDIMATMHSAIFVPETKKIDDMLKEFQRARQHMAVVVDEYGGVAGIVTMEDVLEEIVGDIWDEYDDEPEEYDITKISDREYAINARTNIDSLCEYFNIERTEDMSEYDTVGGLIYDIAGAIPSVGDTFKWRGFNIKIQSMEDNKIQRANFTEEEAPQE